MSDQSTQEKTQEKSIPLAQPVVISDVFVCIALLTYIILCIRLVGAVLSLLVDEKTI